MTANQNESFNGPEGLCENLSAIVTGLIDSSLLLQNALIHHNVNDIWIILADHEEKLLDLDKMGQLWIAISQKINFDDNKNVTDLRTGIRKDLDKLRTIERSNAKLSRSYLGVISKVFSSIGLGMTPKRKSYNSKGRLSKAGSSLLINKLG